MNGRGGVVGAAVIAAVVLLSGCSALSAPELRLSDLLGKHLGEVPEGVTEHAGLLIQDASPRVSLEPAFNLSQIYPSQWTIVAACTDTEKLSGTSHLEIAVIPTPSFADVTRNRGWQDDYADAVVCGR